MFPPFFRLLHIKQSKTIPRTGMYRFVFFTIQKRINNTLIDISNKIFYNGCDFITEFFIYFLH